LKRICNVTIDLILTRAVEPLAALELPPGFSPHRIASATDDAVGRLSAFYTAQQFPPDWTHRMLAQGGRAVLICSGDAPCASAWIMRSPFYVSEVRGTFDAGPDADYYLGDFVTPAFRGQGLQRALIRARLQISGESNRPWAIALTRDNIPASPANYLAEGFQLAAEVQTRKIWRWEFHRLRRKRADLPCGTINR
jgi:GNAT superfamily N-acetyltransferase